MCGSLHDKIKELGVNPIEIRDLDDVETIQKAAREHDGKSSLVLYSFGKAPIYFYHLVVIHMASGFHSGSAEALIRGLAERKKKVGREVHYIHVSLSI